MSSDRSDGVRWSTTRRRVWPAWSGSKEDLTRVGDVFDEIGSKLRRTVLEQIDAEYPDTAPQVRSPYSQMQRDRGARIAARASVTEGSDQVTGRVSSVMERIDRRTAERVIFSLNGENVTDTELQVAFSRRSFHGVELELKSSDRDWVSQTLADLSNELERGTPRWAVFRTWTGRLLTTLMLTVVFVIAFFVSLWPRFHDQGRGLAEAALSFFPFVGFFTFVFFMILSISPVYDWLFPPFEVSADGASSGSRRLAAAGLLAVSIPIGIFVNRVS
jgi:hypothetical protein